MSHFVILALFGLSVAIVEVRDDILRYRRFVKWRAIARHDIIGARIEAPPIIGSLRLNKFLFPWGRLYFALDRNMSPKPFGEGEYPALNHIRDNKGGPSKENEPSAHHPQKGIPECDLLQVSFRDTVSWAHLAKAPFTPFL